MALLPRDEGTAPALVAMYYPANVAYQAQWPSWIEDLYLFGPAQTVGEAPPAEAPARVHRLDKLRRLVAKQDLRSAGEALVRALRDRGLTNGVIAVDLEGMQPAQVEHVRRELPGPQLKEAGELFRYRGGIMPVGRLPRSEQFPRYSKRVIDSVMEVGGERVVGLFDKVYALDPDFAELYVEYVRGAMYSREVLSQPVRELCACAALTLLNRPGLLKAHLLNGAYVGATLDQLREAIVQMVLYGGFPATLTALNVFAETFPEAIVADRPALPATIESLGTDKYYEPAIAAASGIYGEKHVRGVVDQITRWDQAWGQAYQHFVYAGVKDRDVVDIKVRQLLAITGCIVTEQLEDFEVEVQAALRAGLSRAEIQEVILQMSVYLGMPRALKAGRIFERIADAWEQRG